MTMQGRKVLITGAGGGLGQEVTAHFVEATAEVTATVFTPEERTLLTARFGDRLRLVDVDVRDEAAMASTVSDMGGVDALVHLAGGFGMGDTASFERTAYDDLVAINLTTTFVAVRAVLPVMRAAGYGRIVTVSSRSALEPPAQMAVYAATKAAVLAFTQAVADEHRDVDITANTVLPSVIDTPANRAAMGDAEADRWVTPASLAETLLFLASPAARDQRGTAVRMYGRM